MWLIVNMQWVLDFFGMGGSSATVELTLQPDASAKSYAGFGSGQPLVLKGTAGETVGMLMDRFNTYRGPTEQITKLAREDGSALPFSTVLRENIKAILSRN